MLQYIYLAAAVIVIVGIGIVGILLIRRGRQAAREEMDESKQLGAHTVAAQMTFVDPPSYDAVSAPLMAEGASLEQPAPYFGPQSVVPSAAQPLAKPFFGPAAHSEPTLEPAARADAQTQSEAGYLQGVEQLLSEWRTRHDISVIRPATPTNGQVPLTAGTAAVATSAAPAGRQAGRTQAAAFTSPEVSQTVLGQTAPLSYGASADPLGEVVLGLADGRGKLSGAELKRLEVFRPESVELAVQTIQLPTHLRDSEDAAMRLAQIQLYVASLGLRARWTSQAFKRGGLGDIPFSAHDFKLKIARDIMALPTADRSEVIGYLLGGLLGNPESSTQLKRAIIDTVEHMRSAALANVLLDCLDDPDPIVQEYALAAADRLLDA